MGDVAAIRAKHRAAWEAKHPRKRNPARVVTMARLERVSAQARDLDEAEQIRTQREVNAWNAHRAQHRQPVGKPYAKRRASRRERTPHNAAVHGFTVAIAEAEKHRRTLKRRFGYDDKQIGTMAMVHQTRIDIAKKRSSRLTTPKKHG